MEVGKWWHQEQLDLAGLKLLASHGWIIISLGNDMTPEGKIKLKFKKKLDKLNYVYKYMPVPGGYGLPSLDFLLCVNGTFVGVEAKADAKKAPTPRQIQTMKDIREANGLTFVVFDDASIDACIGALVLLIGGQTK